MVWYVSEKGIQVDLMQDLMADADALGLAKRSAPPLRLMDADFLWGSFGNIRQRSTFGQHFGTVLKKNIQPLSSHHCNFFLGSMTVREGQKGAEG